LAAVDEAAKVEEVAAESAVKVEAGCTQILSKIKALSLIKKHHRLQYE
jgi:hypothetical protein